LPILLRREALNIFSTPIIKNDIENSRLIIVNQEVKSIPDTFFYIKKFEEQSEADELITMYCSDIKFVSKSNSRSGFLHKKNLYSLEIVKNCTGI